MPGLRFYSPECCVLLVDCFGAVRTVEKYFECMAVDIFVQIAGRISGLTCACFDLLGYGQREYREK